MIYENEFIENIQENPVSSIIKIIDIAISYVNPHAQEWTEEEYEPLFEGFSLTLSVIENFELTITTEIPKLEGHIDKDSAIIQEFLKSVRSEYQSQAIDLRLQLMKNKFDNVLGQSFSYEFSQGDVDRIQTLINELREQISSSNLFENTHKERLLKRLEKLQAEMHKKMSDFDKFWGLIGDAGIVLGKFGKGSKPFVDRIKEISDIVWRTQARAEELPSDTPPPLLKKDT